MILTKLREYLDGENIKYVVIVHSSAFTAQEVAATAHIPGQELAKTVMVKVDGKMKMVVLPAPELVDFRLLREALGAGKAELATEVEFKGLFPGCEVGAMPPFGNLYGIDVVEADGLADDEEIAFNAGSHRELVKMLYRDYERLVRPTRARFSVSKKGTTGTAATT